MTDLPSRRLIRRSLSRPGADQLKRKNWGVSKLEEHQTQYEVEEITVAREMPHALQFRAFSRIARPGIVDFVRFDEA